MVAEKDKLKVYCETSFVCYLTGDATDDAKIAADSAWLYDGARRLTERVFAVRRAQMACARA